MPRGKLLLQWTLFMLSKDKAAEVSDLEGDDILDFVGGKVQLDAVVHLGVGVWVPDGAAV